MQGTHNATMTPVRWGVLGASRFAQTKAVPGMLTAANVNVVAVASRSQGKARAMAEALGIANAVSSYEALLADDSIEAIYIPLPNHLHVPWSIRAVQAGKHVLCEKPIALSARDLEPLIQAQNDGGVLVAEAFMVRYHPQWRLARQWIREGKIGDVRALTCAFSYTNTDPHNIRNQADVGGGALYDIGCYAVNTARYLLGREPLRVTAMAERDPNMRVDRLTSGLLDFGDAHATFTVGTQHVPHQRVQVLGTQGRIEFAIPFNAPPDQSCTVRFDPGWHVLGSGSEEAVLPAVDQYALQAQAFSNAIRNGSPYENDLADALRNIRVMDALFSAMASGQWVAV